MALCVPAALGALKAEGTPVAPCASLWGLGGTACVPRDTQTDAGGNGASEQTDVCRVKGTPQ